MKNNKKNKINFRQLVEKHLGFSAEPEFGISLAKPIESDSYEIQDNTRNWESYMNQISEITYDQEKEDTYITDLIFVNEVKKRNLHICFGFLPRVGMVRSFIMCYEDDCGNLITRDNEYSNTVNYCPYCGLKAKNQHTIVHYHSNKIAN